MGECRGDAEAGQHDRSVEAAIESVAELNEVARQMWGHALRYVSFIAVHVAENGVAPLALGELDAARAAAILESIT